MSNLFGFFFMAYMILFVIHGSIYTDAMQSVSRLRSSFKSKGVNKKKVQIEINEKFRRIKWMRITMWIIYVVLFVVHLLLISRIEFPEQHVNRNAIYLFVGVCILLFVLNWLIGARIITRKIRYIETK